MTGLTPQEQARLVAAAESWLGTPFHPKAARKGVGVGCVEFVLAAYREAGLLPPVLLDYPWGFWQHASDGVIFATLRAHVELVPPPWSIGDVLTFRRRPWPGNGHSTLYIGDGRVIHAVEGRGVDIWPIRGTILEHAPVDGWRLRRG